MLSLDSFHVFFYGACFIKESEGHCPSTTQIFGETIMETNNVQKTVPTIQAIKPLGEPVGVPVNVPASNTQAVEAMPKISQFGWLPASVRRNVNRIVAESKTQHDVVTAVDKAYPPVLVNGDWHYNKIADIAMVKFAHKQKLH